MNIIIPIGGIGHRFKLDNYHKPKPLINIFGKAMIYHLIDNLNLTKDDYILIIYHNELEKYNFEQTIKYNYPSLNINFVKLIYPTNGSVETILYGLNNIDINFDKKIMIFDCDTFYNIDIVSIFRNRNHNTVFNFIDYDDKPIYSYVKINNDNIIDIKEKQKISNIANTGCYCFINGYLLKQYCDKVIKNNIRFNNEFYTSCVIKEMLNDNLIFKSYIIDYKDFVCIGTPIQLKIYANLFNTDSNTIKIKKRYCFTLENTLVTYPVIPNDHTSIKPIYKNIDILKLLKKFNQYIIIYTTKRMQTNNNKCIQDIASITLDILKKYGIPYDEIYFGKPYADFYIDYLSINSNNDLEKELGIYNTTPECRTFNHINNNKDTITKSSNNNKLMGEIYYYQNIPEQFKCLFPKFIDYDSTSYTIEKIRGVTLSYLYVTESLTSDLFIKYLSTINKLHSYNNDHNDINIYDNYINKIKERYNKFPDIYLFLEAPVLYKKLIDFFEKYKNNNLAKCGMIHGDPVFTNCIINSNNDIKLIDMRGIINDKVTIYGDIFYDYAKIYQSLIGYDAILFNKKINLNYKSKIIEIFENYITENYNYDYIKYIKIITISHIFSLLPLHSKHHSEFYNLINMNILNDIFT